MAENSKSGAAAGLVIGALFVSIFSLLSPGGQYSVTGSLLPYGARSVLDNIPLSIEIDGPRSSYIAGEAVEFSVRQIGGGACVYPELIQIKNLDTNVPVMTWSGSVDSAAFIGCPRVQSYPDDSGFVWSTKGQENPIILNDTGRYAIVATHLSKTVQKVFDVFAENADIQSPDTSAQLASMMKKSADSLPVVQALVERYPSANLTLSANYHSKIFAMYAKYHPSSIVQYSVEKTENGRELQVTIIFDRFYEYSMPSYNIIQCIGDQYSSLSVSELPFGPYSIEKC